MPFDLENMHENHQNLNYYSNYGMSVRDRCSLTLTNQDEYKLIVRSLMILEVLANKKIEPEVAANIIAQGFPGSEFGFEGLSKSQNMVANVLYLRGLLATLNIEEVIKGYIAHDLGKCMGFVEAYGLVKNGEAPQAAAHDDYLAKYLESESGSELRAIFDNSENDYFINLLDFLGHSPQELQASANFASLEQLGKTHLLIQKFKAACNVTNVTEEHIKEQTRIHIIELLNNQARQLSLNEINVDFKSKFTDLDDEIQKNIAFLMWTGGLRIASEPDSKVIRDLKVAWSDPDNTYNVFQMTKLLMSNLDQSEGYCGLYNPANLFHKTDDSGRKAFIGTEASGGMGGSMDEVVKVGFPYILECCRDANQGQRKTYSHNPFQVKQILEVLGNTFPHLAELTKDQNSYIFADFTELACNIQLQEKLAEHRNSLHRNVRIEKGSTHSGKFFLTGLSDGVTQQLGEQIIDDPNLSFDDPSNQPNPQNLSMLVLRGFLLALGAGAVALAFVVLGTTTPAGVAALAVGGLVMGVSLFGLFRGCCSKPQPELVDDSCYNGVDYSDERIFGLYEKR